MIALRMSRFDSNTYLVTRQRAEQIKAPPEPEPTPSPEPDLPPASAQEPAPDPYGGQKPLLESQKETLRLTGTVPMESWNMVGRRILTKLHGEEGLNTGVNLSVSVDTDRLKSLEEEIRLALTELKLEGQVNMTTDL